MFLQVPAYKSGDLGILSTSSHTIDSLKLFMYESLQKVLKDFSTYRLGSGTGPDEPELTKLDSDLVTYWDDFEKEAEKIISLVDPSSCWLKDFRSSLIREIDACVSYWREMMSGKGEYRWKSISSTPQKDSIIATIMTSSFDNSTTLGKWELLKASLTFQKHYSHSRFVWQIAGRQLRFIKASRIKVGKKDDMSAPAPVVSRMYRILRPDTRFIERVLSHEDRASDDD
ncbi:hypothetical protein NW756_012715 [Fusarium oxysporum]|nr:hypothetical protein NW763_009901 [Fusarium oxysporum]KAJ4076706.1 hypothetical protein NW756_012715 [Fusarium oxysporum]